MELITYKGFKWVVKRKLIDHESVDIAAIKEACYADMCLRKHGLLYFVEIIEDVEFEEIKEDAKDDN